MIHIRLFIISIVFSFFIMVFNTTGIYANSENAPVNHLQVNGQVMTASPVIQDSITNIRQQTVTIEILSGEYRGNIIKINNGLLTTPRPNIVLKAGDKIILAIEKKDNKITNAYINEYVRSNTLYLLVLSYFLLLILVGGIKGLKSAFALSLTCFFLAFILFPLLLKGYNPLYLTTLVLVLITFITMPIISGINRKTLTAIFGTAVGVIIAGLIAYYSGELLNLTGFLDEAAQDLVYFRGFNNIDLKGLLFSAMIIGALGATMDVGMSIASSIDEVKKANPIISPIKLFKSGMNVGKDIMGTMTNTLVLAYVGSSLPVLLLLTISDISTVSLLNSEFVATEVLRALSGSIGLTLTIPFTSMFGAFLAK